MQQTQARRTTVDIDTRRKVVMLARDRKPRDVAVVNHETFIRNALKDALGWPRREQAPDSIKEVAKQMAAVLIDRDLQVAAAKGAALAAFKAKHKAAVEPEAA